MGIRFAFAIIFRLPGTAATPATRTDDYPKFAGMVEIGVTFPDPRGIPPRPVELLTPRPPAKVFPFPRREPLRFVAGGAR